MNYYELSIRGSVSRESLGDLLAEHLGVDRQKIGSEIDYWERLHTSSPLVLGLSVESNDAGYRTYAKWVQPDELTPESYLTLAFEAAKKFAEDVAIPDVLNPSDTAIGKYLLVTPDGRVQRAIETENASQFAVQLLPGFERVVDILHALLNSRA